MEELEPPQSINPGLTLIEVLISLVIFSVSIGLSTHLITTGMTFPFISHQVEPWLVFMEGTTQAIAKLPDDSKLLSGFHNKPKVTVPLPNEIHSWNIEWKNSQLSGYRYVIFSASRKGGGEIQWKMYRNDHSSQGSVID